MLIEALKLRRDSSHGTDLAHVSFKTSRAPGRCSAKGTMESDMQSEQSCFVKCYMSMARDAIMSSGIGSPSCHIAGAGGAQDHDPLHGQLGS